MWYIIVFDVKLCDINVYYLKNEFYDLSIYDNKFSIIVIFNNDYFQKSIINYIFDNYVNDLHENIKFIVNKQIDINLYYKKLQFIGFNYLDNNNYEYNIFEMKLNNNDELYWKKLILLFYI